MKKEFLMTFILAFIPEEWRKPIGASIITVGILFGTYKIIEVVAVDKVEAAYKTIHSDSESKYGAIHNRMNYQEDKLNKISTTVTDQATKIDRMDGKMDTVIYLLRKQ